MRILDYVSADTVTVAPAHCLKEDIIAALSRLLAQAGKVSDAALLAAAVLKREEVISTAMGDGIAIPHAKLEGIASPSVAVGICPSGAQWNSPDGKPVGVVILIASCLRDDGAQLKILAALARHIKTPGFLTQLQSAGNAQDVLDAFAQFESTIRL